MYRCRTEELYGMVRISSSQLVDMQSTITRTTEQRQELVSVTPNWKTQYISAKNPASVKILLENWRCCRDVTLMASAETFMVQKVRRKSLDLEGRHLFPEGGRKLWGLWACHFLMETAHWITRTACGCSVPNRSTSGPSLKSLQIGSSLLFWEGSLEKHQAVRTYQKVCCEQWTKNWSLWSCAAV